MKIIEIDKRSGKMRISRKAVIPSPNGELYVISESGGSGGGGGGDRRDDRRGGGGDRRDDRRGGGNDRRDDRRPPPRR